MLKSRKKKVARSNLSISTDVNQTSISKYFLTSSCKQPNLLKRSSAASSDVSAEKTPKLPCISNEAANLKSTISSSEETDLNTELEQSSLNLKETCSLSNCTKIKLSLFAFKKQSNTNESEKSKLITKHSKYGKSSALNGEFLSSEEMDTTEESLVLQDTEQIIFSRERSIKYTPLEKQYLEFQAKYPDAVLLIECGYKYRFFEKDAKIASRDLNIGCYPYHNFLSASIPVHRLHYHVRRLVMKGYKVAVIKQTESTALKAAGDTKNELFARKLHAMYSKSTFMEEELSVLNDENSVEVDDSDDCDTVSGYLICIHEIRNSQNQFDVACVALQVSSGDIFYSSFQANLIESELGGILMCINPLEILLPSSNLSKQTENLVNTFSCDRSARIERLDDNIFECTFALNNMSTFICNPKDISSPTSEMQYNMQIFLSLPPLVISCLSALKVYLSDFKVENILKNVQNIKPFSTVDHMTLTATTLKGLEVLRHSLKPPNSGTLFWCMNRTITKFGERLLKSWLVKPLKDIEKIEERLNIVTEIIHSDSIIFKNISKMLYRLPDLERLLCTVFYHKCSCYDFLKLVTALTSFRNELVGLTDRINADIEVMKLKIILLSIIKNLEGIENFTANIDPQAAKEGNKIKLFLHTSKYASMETCKSIVSTIENNLNNLRPLICKILRLPTFQYATVAGQRFLIEVPNSHLSLVPDDWLKISSTKQVSRFRSPEVTNLYKQLEQQEESLLELANEAWEKFLNEFGEYFFKYKHAVSNLAEIDVYLSFAKIAKDENYCRPVIINTMDRKFNIVQGWHPVTVKVMGEEKQFVSNDINLNDTERCLIVTGPNMGGKSTYIRQTAFIALLAHVGCFVPAESATIPLLDGIYVRLGADDEIINKKSTFMSEMNEASNILSSATSKSLVILDELGRGTSTNDGTAIAYATLKYLITEVKCFILFVTHYPLVAELKNYYPVNIATVHMAYILKEIDSDDDIETVTFLYHVVPGISEKSYGINVAALAGISKDILSEAQRKSREMELKRMVQRRLGNILCSLESANHDINR